jgi:hypothetical protein
MSLLATDFENTAFSGIKGFVSEKTVSAMVLAGAFAKVINSPSLKAIDLSAIVIGSATNGLKPNPRIRSAFGVVGIVGRSALPRVIHSELDKIFPDFPIGPSGTDPKEATKGLVCENMLVFKLGENEPPEATWEISPPIDETADTATAVLIPDDIEPPSTDICHHFKPTRHI